MTAHILRPLVAILTIVFVGLMPTASLAASPDVASDLNELLASPEVSQAVTPEQAAALRHAAETGELAGLAQYLTSPEMAGLKSLLESGQLDQALKQGDVAALTGVLEQLSSVEGLGEAMKQVEGADALVDDLGLVDEGTSSEDAASPATDAGQAQALPADNAGDSLNITDAVSENATPSVQETISQQLVSVAAAFNTFV